MKTEVLVRLVGALVLTLLLAPHAVAVPAKQLNSVFILAGELGYGDLGCCNPGRCS